MTDLTATTAPVTGTSKHTLRRLYLVRFGFALIWAIALAVTASTVEPSIIGPLSAALLVLYPLFDVGAVVVDARSSRSSRIVPGLSVNIAISTVAAIGLVVAVTSGVPAVLRVWGIRALVAGLVQLAVALRRRGLGGQWAMIVSGSVSALAGIAFFLMAGAAHASLSSLAGYALLGGIFFGVSALRLGSTGAASPDVHPGGGATESA